MSTTTGVDSSEKGDTRDAHQGNWLSMRPPYSAADPLSLEWALIIRLLVPASAASLPRSSAWCCARSCRPWCSAPHGYATWSAH
ncbi:hypothetical protein ACWCRF_01955 [Streptomyces sp. NPDC002405]|uniref:hypothetical protein n=1 Tax=unclassified Streptomyces TaxID=2593676 RepID=UPI003692C01D